MVFTLDDLPLSEYLSRPKNPVKVICAVDPLYSVPRYSATLDQRPSIFVNGNSQVLLVAICGTHIYVSLLPTAVLGLLCDMS